MTRLGVVIPTIKGREESLERTLAAYRETLHGHEYEIRVVADFSSWPAACNEGARQLGAGLDVVHYGADDLVPVGDWLPPCLSLLEAGELPAPRVWNYEKEGEPWSRYLDGPDGDLTDFTRVPILTIEMMEAIGPWPEIIYSADCWVSAKARCLGWPTRVAAGYDFVHYWSQVGRLDGDAEAMDAARHRYLEEIVELERLFPGQQLP